MLRDAPQLLLLLTLAAACDGSSADSATGVGAAGASGTAGRPATGGNAGTAGMPATGGNAGTAGMPATGGNAGTAGTPATGGNAGAAGTGDAAGNVGTAGTGGAAGGITYSTDFDLTESPLSEKGAWHHDGLDWTVVESSNGVASNTQALGVGRSGPTQYNDSYAYLTGFPADQQATANVHLGTIDGSCTHEVEILLRWADSAHNARGYECNVAFDGSYAQIVRWNGAVGDYMYLANGSVPGGIHENDVVSAQVIGDQIKLSVNGVVRATAQDATFPTGNPGIGFWRGSSGCGTIGDFGFTHYSASAVTK